MNTFKHYTSIAITAVVAMFFFTTACKNDVEEVQIATEILDIPLRVQNGIHYEYSDSSRKQIDIKAPVVKDFSNSKKPYREFAEGIEVTFYDKTETKEAFLKANYAKQFDKDSKWIARGDVIVINNKGEKLNTEYLLWDQKEETISSDKQVIITTDGNVLRGRGFEADQAFENWKIFNPEGEFELEDEEGTPKDTLTK